jgi:hypothetical protein
MSTDEYPVISGDAAIERQALSLGWVLDPDKKQEMVDRQFEISKTAEPREATAAARVLAQLNAQNIAVAASPSIMDEGDGIESVSAIELLIQMRNTIPSDQDAD